MRDGGPGIVPFELAGSEVRAEEIMSEAYLLVGLETWLRERVRPAAAG